MDKTAFLLVGLLVGAVAGFGGGFMMYQSQINGLQTEIEGLGTEVSSLESERSDLQAQVATLLGNISILQSNLDDSLGTVSALESDLSDTRSALDTLEASLGVVCDQLEKDRLFLLKHLLERQTFSGVEEEISEWNEVRELSLDVDPELAPKIDLIVEAYTALISWTERAPPEYASDQEVSEWLLEGYILLGQFNQYYFDFEATYVSDIETHVAQVIDLSG